MSSDHFKPVVSAAELIEMALGMAATQGIDAAGRWLAARLHDNRDNRSAALGAMQAYRAGCPKTNAGGEPEEYAESEMLAAIDQVYGNVGPRKGPQLVASPDATAAPPTQSDKTSGKQGNETKTEKRKNRPPKVSAGFEVNDSGLYRLEHDAASGKTEPVWLSSPITPAGFASDEANASWNLVVEFPDLRKRTHTCLLPRDSFAGQSGEQVVRPLLAEGLKLSPARGAAEAVRRFLMQSQPERQFLLVDKPGWYDGVFALGDSVFGDTTATKVIQRAAPQSLLCVKGLVEDWIAGIGTHARQNKRLQHGISMGFAAPLCHLVGAESGVFHLKARSRQGKTTILLCAGSVCGGGGRLGYAHSWLMTPNAAELACVAHNDLLLCLDELKLLDPKFAGNLAYIVASGQGKQRMQKTLSAAPTLLWRVLGLSSGELDLSTHVASAAQAGELYGGQLVRFVEMPEPDGPFGMFNSIPDGETAKEFADKLQRNARRCYGAPLRKFLAEIVPRRDHYAKQAVDIIRRFTAENTGPEDSAETVDVAQRFGLVLAGGIIATRVGCTDWDEDEVWQNEVDLFKEWKAARPSSAPADEERAVRQVRQILESHGSRFASFDSDALDRESATPDEPNREGIAPRDQLGFRFRRQFKGDDGEPKTETVFLVWPEAWATTFCKGLDPAFVARVIRNRGHLLIDKDGSRLQFQKRVPGYSDHKRFYAIRETVLD